ncbi:SCL-interrupting locus protein-like [Centruroides vittatus]|uniref:SCL-interrupting locus protein-like n=1 Tax=Centruroides vittatus TaxID=120091 RepID=UPI00350FD1F0
MEINEDGIEDKEIGYQECIMPFQVSNSLAPLWDHQICGPSSIVRLCPYRNPILLIRDKALSSGWNLLEEKKQITITSSLMGLVNLDSKVLDGRFDILLQHLEGNGGAQPSVCDIVVPIKFVKKSCHDDFTDEDFLNDADAICLRCRNDSPIVPSDFVKLRICCAIRGPSCLVSAKMVVPDVEFSVTPVPRIPILQTALSNKLLNSENEMQTGFVSMDKMRNLVMLLENDPKVFGFPIVGIWVSGIPNIFHPFVWVSCLRYISCSKYSERLCLPPQTFIVVLYSSLYGDPEFYDFVTRSGTCHLSYNLYTGSTATSLARVPVVDSKVTKIELSRIADKTKLEFLNTTEERLKEMSAEKSEKKREHRIADNIDMPQICPHPQQIRIINPKPTVPDLSLSDSINRPLLETNGARKDIGKTPFVTSYSSQDERNISKSLLTSHILNSKESRENSSNIALGEKENPVHFQDVPLKKSLIPIKKQLLLLTHKSDLGKIKSKCNDIQNTVTNTETEKGQKKNTNPEEIHTKAPALQKRANYPKETCNKDLILQKENAITKEILRKESISKDIYELLRHQEEQLQHLQQQIQQILKAQNENHTKESSAEKQNPSVSVSTMTSLSLKDSENQASKEQDKILKTEGVQTDDDHFYRKYNRTRTIKSNLCERSNPKQNINSQINKFDSLKQSDGYNVWVAEPSLPLDDIRLDTVCENHESISSSIYVDIPDYPASTCSGANDAEESSMLGESASIVGNVQPETNIPAEVPSNMFYENILGNIDKVLSKQIQNKVEESPDKNDDKVERDEEDCIRSKNVHQLDTIREVVRGNLSENIYQNILENINGFLLKASNSGQQVKRSVKSSHLYSFGNWMADVSLITSGEDISFGLGHLPRLRYTTLPEVDESVVTNALVLKYLGDECPSRLTKAKSSSEGLAKESLENRPTDFTLYGLSPSNVSFATKNYLEKHGLVAVRSTPSQEQTPVKRN